MNRAAKSPLNSSSAAFAEPVSSRCSVDTARHRIVDDKEIKDELAAEHPYGEWLKNKISLDDLPERVHVVHSHASVTRRQQVFGYTHEHLRLLIAPMANTGAEVIGSMATSAACSPFDTPRPTPTGSPGTAA